MLLCLSAEVFSHLGLGEDHQAENNRVADLKGVKSTKKITEVMQGFL